MVPAVGGASRSSDPTHLEPTFAPGDVSVIDVADDLADEVEVAGAPLTRAHAHARARGHLHAHARARGHPHAHAHM